MTWSTRSTVTLCDVSDWDRGTPVAQFDDALRSRGRRRLLLVWTRSYSSASRANKTRHVDDDPVQANKNAIDVRVDTRFSHKLSIFYRPIYLLHVLVTYTRFTRFIIDFKLSTSVTRRPATWCPIPTRVKSKLKSDRVESGVYNVKLDRVHRFVCGSDFDVRFECT